MVKKIRVNKSTIYLKIKTHENFRQVPKAKRMIVDTEFLPRLYKNNGNM